jgi:hypothetical protein
MNNQLIRLVIFILLFVIPGFSGITLFASRLSTVDSSQVIVRQMDQKFVDAYKTQKEFIYTQPPLETNFLKQLIEYLKSRFKALEQLGEVIPLIFKVLLWAMVLFFLFIVITKTKLYKLFYTDKEFETPAFEFSANSDQSLDLDEEIRLQVEKQQYRLAIRLLYLKVINKLRSKEYIRFSKEKTNFDYLRDLTNTDLKSRFFAITSIYNHVWYGDVEIAEDQFLRFEKSFQSLYTAIDVQG